MRNLYVFFVMLLISTCTPAQKTWQWNSLPTLNAALYQKAMEKHQGIIGMDDLFPSIAQIGMGTVSVETFPPFRPTHFPIDGSKRPHTGVMTYLHKRPQSVTDSDDDVNMYILPNPGNTYFESFMATGRSKKNEVEAEIDVNYAFWATLAQRFPKAFAQVTGYGAWVHEKHNYWDTRVHDYIEIHPMEHMWSSELVNNKMQYNIGIFSDNSGKMNRWRPNPVNTISAIAFEFSKGQKPLEFVIDQYTNLQAIAYPLYTDNARVHVLMDGADTILIVREPERTPTDIYSIDFGAVSKSVKAISLTRDLKEKTNNLGEVKYAHYKGFIKVHASVKDGGHNSFRIVEKTRTITPLIRVDVHLVSIHCLSVDDDDDDEDLYGSYGVSAAVGGSPYHLNSYTPGANSTLWQRHETNPLKLKKGRSEIINALRYYMVSPNGEIVVYGDLDEKDTGIGGGGDNDELSSPQHKRFKVSELGINVPKVITDVYQSGGTKVNVIYIVKRRN
jgi:hypothetical protein